MRSEAVEIVELFRPAQTRLAEVPPDPGGAARPLALGFGAAALVASRQQVQAGDFALLVGLSAVLALAMLSVGLLISTVARRAGAALGAAIVLWLLLVFLGDLGLKLAASWQDVETKMAKMSPHWRI